MENRNGLKAAFIAGIDGLGNLQKLCNILLAQVAVLAQVTSTLEIHEEPPVVLFDTIDNTPEPEYNGLYRT